MLLGGGARQGYLSDVILQLLAVPLLAIAITRIDFADRKVWPPLAFCLLLVAVPLLQLIPLPPSIWTGLPLRSLALQSLELSGQSPLWRPLSLTPHATWQSMLSLLFPIALFLAVLTLSRSDRQNLCLLVVGLSVVVSFLGLLHAGQGGSAALQDSSWQGSGYAMGVFANRNHFAALLYTALLLAAAFAIDNAKRMNTSYGSPVDTHGLILTVIGFTVIVALLAAQVIARSRAGLGLSIVALLAIAAMANADRRERPGLAASKLMAGAVALVLIFGSQFALYQIMERLAVDPLQDARITIAHNTILAAWTAMPWGSGLGSFVPVYQYFEQPSHAITGAFINRAHNDVLEVWLETGVAGVLLMILFGIWLLWTLWRVWWRDETGGSPLDVLLVRASTLAIVLLIAHSLVDYPLRTTALMSIFAMACGLLFAPVGEVAAARAPSEERHAAPHPAARAERRRRPEIEPVPAPSTAASAGKRSAWAWPSAVHEPQAAAVGSKAGLPAGATELENSQRSGAQPDRWGADIEWPADWRSPPKPSANRAKEGSGTT